MKQFSKRSLSSLAAALALLSPVVGSAFELRPMTQTFEPSGRGVNGTFEVHNDLDEEVAVTMTIKARTLDAKGVETLKDTKDFTIFPTEMMLKGKSLQVVRVRWQGASVLPAERSYRIIAEEVQLKQFKSQAASRSGIKLILRYGGTLYVASPESRADVAIVSAKKVDGKKGAALELEVENRGSRHAILDKPSLTVKVGETTRLLSTADLGKAFDGENILAGSTRRIRLPWPEGLPAGPVEAKLDASFLR